MNIKIYGQNLEQLFLDKKAAAPLPRKLTGSIRCILATLNSSLLLLTIWLRGKLLRVPKTNKWFLYYGTADSKITAAMER